MIVWSVRRIHMRKESIYPFLSRARGRAVVCSLGPVDDWGKTTGV